MIVVQDMYILKDWLLNINCPVMSFDSRYNMMLVYQFLYFYNSFKYCNIIERFYITTIFIFTSVDNCSYKSQYTIADTAVVN